MSHIDGLEQIIALVGRSASLRQEGRTEAALGCLQQALAVNPRLYPLHLNCARLMGELGCYEEAIAAYGRYLRDAPDDGEAAAQCRQLQQEAEEHYGTQLEIDRDNVDFHVLRGNIRLGAGRAAAALADFDQARRLDPRCWGLEARRGEVMFALYRHEEALAALDRALEREPGNLQVRLQRGRVLQALGRWEAAFASYEQLLCFHLDHPEALVEQAHCCFALGRWREGWQRYEWRWETRQMADAWLPSNAPLWLGRHSPEGRTVLLWAEQGLGDTLQFLRYVPRVAALGARVLLLLPPSLAALAASLGPGIEVLPAPAELPPHHLHCPLLSLPLALGLCRPEEGPGTPYLRASPERAARMPVLPAFQGRRIGLVWSAKADGDAGRNLALAQLQPLLGPGRRFYCLQQMIPAADQETLAALPQLQRVDEWLEDWADTAALVQQLDLVISVDTAVAHLAGALGRPCWLLLQHGGEWRWGRQGAATPWYASLRLFRQPAWGDWDGAVAQVAAALADWRGG